MTETENATTAETGQEHSSAGRVVVGLDGSEGADHALEWALTRQAIFGPVDAVLSYQVEVLGDGLGSPGMYADIAGIMREDAKLRLAKAIEGKDGLSDRAALVQGHAGPSLVRAAAEADLLVVGSRGRSALTETVFGSVGSYCVKYCGVPVAVIPEGSEQKPTLDRIVVGVDGSENSEAALRWAIDHVSATGQIEAIGCYTSPNINMNPVSTGTVLPEIEKAVIDAVKRVVESQDGDANIEIRAEFGDARSVLRDAAKSADLLVVGARGHRGVAYLLVGSVTTSLLHHPVSPTVVVPES